MSQENDFEHLKKIADFEDTHDMSEFRIGWFHHHVRIGGTTLHNLFLKGYLDIVSRSSSHTGYRLTDLGKQLIISARNDEAVADDDTPIPTEGLFEDIVGHDEVKELLVACLLAEKPVHVLLSGPPALAKSVFLWDIERAAGSKARWLIGSSSSFTGVWDDVAKYRPKILLIDELDKMKAVDIACLLSLMEGGRLVRAKKGRELDIEIPVRVVAASNVLRMLSPELKSRFAIRRLPPYSRPEYMRVVRGVLVRREGLTPELADEIARRLDGISQDVRHAIRAARLAPQKGVARAIKLLDIGGNKE
ncbi:MAG: AAA family ATPase [Dehalococcoidales bacterium]|jgi:Holliday junction DNA helicase RuvB|nr:AAA family ATPase [Dehalococcoidales bacterium]